MARLSHEPKEIIPPASGSMSDEVECQLFQFSMNYRAASKGASEILRHAILDSLPPYPDTEASRSIFRDYGFGRNGKAAAGGWERTLSHSIHDTLLMTSQKVANLRCRTQVVRSGRTLGSDFTRSISVRGEVSPEVSKNLEP
jgi:hypothetical protein